MGNVVRLVACVAILIGLSAELALGLLLPSRIKVEYAPPRHLVNVELPSVDQVVPWCEFAMRPDPSVVNGRLYSNSMDCDIDSDR